MSNENVLDTINENLGLSADAGIDRGGGLALRIIKGDSCMNVLFT
jgi:hypothetical protein